MVDTYPMSVPAAEVKRLLDYVNVVEHVEEYISQRSGNEIERLLDIVSFTEYNMPVGLKWDYTTTSPIFTTIDVNGNRITPTSSFWDNHAIWGNIKTVVRNRSTGVITAGSNPRGDGLTIDGTAGDVLVEYPTARYLYDIDETYRYLWFFSDIDEYRHLPYYPAAVQRGGGAHSKIYVGAKEAYGYLDGATYKLGSAAGKAPIRGGVSYPDLPNSGRLNMTDAETYANNIGAGFGCMNIWTERYISLLMAMELGTFNTQYIIGRGITFLDPSTGSPMSTGADSIDLPANTAVNGTGMGTGLDGYTPIKWRGLENQHGNLWKLCIGLNASSSTGAYNILPMAGASATTIPAVLTSGMYTTGAGTVPLTAGYISGIQNADTLGGVAFIPSAVAGSTSTYLCDYYYPPNTTTSVARVGGRWSSELSAGPWFLDMTYTATGSDANTGCRIEYIPQ